jgi:23S rRNA pseudouridine1911/1915/1917 synthase
MKQWTISEADAGARLDAWLARQPDVMSRGRASDWIARGKVFLNGTPVEPAKAGRKVRAGDHVGLWVDRPGSSSVVDHAVRDARSQLHVLHEDAAIVVVNKPPGVIVEPLPGYRDDEVTLVHLLDDHGRHQPRARFHVVHRIDRDTSGLVLFARTPAARDALKAQFEAHTPVRIYQAVVRGRVSPAAGVWRDLLSWDKDQLIQRRAHGRDARAKDAIAKYKVLELFVGATLIEVSLVTGKRNQIRVQAGIRGFPLVGERQYRFGAPPDPPGTPTLDRQALHAWRLEFLHPTTGRRTRFTAPVPDDMRLLIDALREADASRE